MFDPIYSDEALEQSKKDLEEIRELGEQYGLSEKDKEFLQRQIENKLDIKKIFNFINVKIITGIRNDRKTRST